MCGSLWNAGPHPTLTVTTVHEHHFLCFLSVFKLQFCMWIKNGATLQCHDVQRSLRGPQQGPAVGVLEQGLILEQNPAFVVT